MFTIAPHPLHSIQRFGRTPAPFSGDPCLYCSDYRAPTLLAGCGEVGVRRVAFVPLECIDPQAPLVCAEDVVLIGVDTQSPISLPKSLQHQSNIDFVLPGTKALSQVAITQIGVILRGFGLLVLECEWADLATPYKGRVLS